MSYLGDPATLLNSLANEPEILHAISPGAESVDLSGFFALPGSVMMGDADGVALFIHFGQGVYEGHILFSRRMRGRFALYAMRRMIAQLFTAHKARAIVAAIPVTNLPMRLMARAVGCAPYGSSTDALGRSCTDMILERDTWEHLQAGLSADWAATLAPKHKPKLQKKPLRLH